MTEKQPQIGDVYMMRFSGFGSEQSGWRPGLVFQNNTGNRYSPNIIALPFTSSVKKRGQPTHVLVPASHGGLPKDSIILCENPERMSKERLGQYITTLSSVHMEQVAVASLLASSAISYISQEKIVEIWEKAIKLNDLQVLS